MSDDQGERLRESFDANDVSAYLREIETWRDDLRDMATVTLEMLENIGGTKRERDDLGRALASLRSIDELVKIIGELPYTHVQTHALHQLWAVIGAAFVIGSRAVKNPVSGKVVTAPGRSRLAEKRAPADQRIREAITEAAKSCPLPPRRRGRLTWIDGEAAHQLRMKVTTVTSHRKKLLIV
jgi:hypothetical protein